MKYRDEIREAYFNWMYEIVCADRFADDISYRRLLRFLHGIRFDYIIPKDKNRAEDGVDLRYRFALFSSDMSVRDHLGNCPCSVLEMILALAIRCEENIMDDPRIGDRTGQWFWGMITNLGLGAMNDDRFDDVYVKEVVKRFLKREYEPNGKGGLFTVRHCDHDLRDVEIWYQLCWYLDSIT